MCAKRKRQEKKKPEELTVDEFLAGGLDSDDSDSEIEENGIGGSEEEEESEDASSGPNDSNSDEEEGGSESGVEESDEEGDEDDSEGEDEEDSNDDSKEKTDKESQKPSKAAIKHKASLEKLKEKDPEFYKFLANEDKDLLGFDPTEISGSEGEEDEEDQSESEESEEEGGANVGSDESDSDDSDDEKGTVHKLPSKLEVASDSESEGDSDEETKTSGKKKELITMKMVNKWSQDLKAEQPFTAIKNSTQAFRAVVHSNKQDKNTSKYKVAGSAVFNGVIRLCITDLLPAFNTLLNVSKKAKDEKLPSLIMKKPVWEKIRVHVKIYLGDILKFLGDIKEAAIVSVLLKHCFQLLGYFMCFPTLARVLLKRLISVWSAGEETCRVLAFLSINKLARNMKNTMLEPCFKQMYMAYVKNCKFTSPTTLPNINFMQRSLVEIYLLDSAMCYQFAFIYIRQLAIHLRNAITVPKKETRQAVYNWQYIHSLNLWTKLLCQAKENDVLEPLIYPLSQTIIGTIKLLPTSKYYPLRFHCVRLLNMLSNSTGVYIPVLPFLSEVLQQTDFNKKHKSLSMKQLNFACILKFSKSQIQEKAYREGLVDQLYELYMDHLNVHSHSIGFPELVLPLVAELKKFNKTCKVANFTKTMKQILDKINETSKLIVQRRKSSTLDIKDSKCIEAWEKRSAQEGTPIAKFYSQWRKLRDRELQFNIAGKERISIDHNLPTIERRKGPGKASDTEKKEFKGLFASDSEDSDSGDDDDRFLLKEERPAKKQKTSHAVEEEDEDFSDFDENELAQLAGSGEEDSEEGDEDEEDDGGDDDDEMEDDNDVDLDDVDDKGDIVEDFQWSSDDNDDSE